VVGTVLLVVLVLLDELLELDVDDVVLVLEVVDDDVLEVLVSVEVVVVEVVVVEELVDGGVVVVVGGAQEQCAGTSAHVAKPSGTAFERYRVAVSGKPGLPKRVQNRSAELPNMICSSTSPCGVPSSPYVMPPRFFSLILPSPTWPTLFVASSFHLYRRGAMKAGTPVHPGSIVGAVARFRHWQSVALNTTAEAPLL
jgi:hypothetical protein